LIPVRLHVDRGRPGDHAEFRRVMYEIGGFRAPDFILAGQAVGVRARTADQLAFDDGRSLAALGAMPR
jgi:hypothetical protein